MNCHNRARITMGRRAEEPPGGSRAFEAGFYGYLELIRGWLGFTQESSGLWLETPSPRSSPKCLTSRQKREGPFSRPPTNRRPFGHSCRNLREERLQVPWGWKPCTKECPRNANMTNGRGCKVMTLSAWHGWQQMQEREDFCQDNTCA